MSTSHVEVGYDLVNGMFTVLNNNVTVGAVTYPVYKSIPKTPATTYVWIGGVIHVEDGTKEDFIYSGTVQVQVVDLKERADKKLMQSIIGVTRGLLKTSKASVFSIGSRTLTVFKHESYNDYVRLSDEGLSEIKGIDIYGFIIN